VFLQVLFFQHHVHEWIFNTFSINLHLVSLQLNFNLVVEFNSSCNQCNSIFSFEWNSIFMKLIHFFHQLIVISSL